ncbi:hypothetical protein [Rhodopseudomonas parapalustris]
MTNWRDLEAKADEATGRLFGERVRLSFLKSGVVDPSRPAVDITAILHCGGDHSSALGAGFTTWLSAGKAELIIDRSSYVDPLNPHIALPMPKKQDKVRGLDRRGTPWWEIASVSDRYSNLLVLALNEA